MLRFARSRVSRRIALIRASTRQAAKRLITNVIHKKTATAAMLWSFSRMT